MSGLKNGMAVFLFWFSLSAAALAEESGTVHHPAPQQPKYLSASLYEAFARKLPAPPRTGSKEQKADELHLFSLQKSRTIADCERAKSEVFVSLASFFGGLHGPLTAAETERFAEFFEQLRNDGDYFIQKMKVDFPRERPFAYIAGLEPCVPREVTGAYPSGHATLARLYGLILGNLFPANRKKLNIRAEEIARDRVLSGMHHPTDIAAGQALGELLYAELKKSKKFREDLRKLTHK